jgi:hypothetical protein
MTKVKKTHPQARQTSKTTNTGILQAMINVEQNNDIIINHCDSSLCNRKLKMFHDYLRI